LDVDNGPSSKLCNLRSELGETWDGRRRAKITCVIVGSELPGEYVLHGGCLWFVDRAVARRKTHATGVAPSWIQIWAGPPCR